MKHLFTSKRKGYLLFSFIVFFSTHVHSQCTLNASISGNTSVCTGNTTLTANVTGASSCSGSEGVGLIYNMDYCQFGTPYPATVTPSNCGISLTSVENFTAGYSAANSCTQNGAEGSSQSMCAPQSNSTYFNDPTSLPNQYGFFFTVGASATSSGVLSKVSFYVRGSIALSGPVSSTLFGIRITDPSGSIVYYEQSGLSVPRYAWQQYTIDLSTDPDFVLSGTVKQYRVFIQGYAPEPGFVPVDATGQELRTILEIDQVRVYYGCGSASSTPTYSWTGPNGFTSSQQSITATTAGTYYVTVTDCKGCSVTKSVVVTGCANCSISSVSATPSACNSSTNTYSTSGSIYFSNPPSSGTLTVSDGTASQTFYAPFTSPLSYTLTGINANGSTHTVNASFSATNCSNSTTYTAPQSCAFTPCSVSFVTATPGACNASTNTYSTSGYVYFSNPPSSGTLTVSDGTASQTFYVPFTSPLAYTLTGIAANGSTHTVNASFSAANCSNSSTYTAPQSCAFTPCSISFITATPGACNSSTNTYSTSGSIYFSNPPSSGMLTVSDGTASQTLYPPFTSPMAYTITGITANGTTHTVNASFSATNCSNSSTYTAPQSCSIVPSCSISSITATPGACNSSTNTYSTSGSIYFSNPPSTGTLTVSDGTASQTFFAPFTSPLSYTLTGITANGSTHTVSASFSAASCSKTTTYTAPMSCAVSSCTVSITAIPGTCTPSTNTYSVSGRATIFNARGGSTITFTDGVTSQSYTVPSSQVSTTYVDYTLTGFTSNGNSHTVTAVVSNGASCSGTTTYNAPMSCLCTNPTPSVNSPTICAGSSATLTVSNCAGSVTWNDGTTGLTKTVSPTTTTSYTATCTVTNGNCSGTGTATGTVTVTPKPTPSVNNPTMCAGSSATLSVSNCAGTVTWNDGTTGATKTVSPTATTTYTATCSVGTCTGTASGTVTITTTSNPTPSINSPTICAGSSATLTVSNCAGTVTWNDGTTGLTKTVSPTTTTSYTATCTVTNGNCTGTGTASGTVTVTPKPTPSVNNPSICAGSSATLTVSNCSGTVTWNDGTAGATKTVSPTVTTTYTATCTVGSCTGTATGTVTVTTASNPTPSVNSPSICAGSSVTLTVSNCAGSVTWNDGTTGLTKTVSPTATTSYTATCTVTNGNCSGTGIATGTVTVTPKPTPSVNSPTICASSSATLTVSNCAGTVTWNDGTTGATKTVSPTATTTFTATCSVGTCTGTASGTVTVTTASNPTPSVNSPTICSGSSATLTVSNCAGSVTWNDGTTGLTKTVSPTTTTSYTATCTVTNGNCSGTGTATGTVTVTPKPSPSVNSPTICSGSSATLTVSNCAGSVTWNDGTTGATKTVSPTATTTYTATCSVGTCTGTASGTVTVTTASNPTPSVNSPTICSGSSATLTVSNCAGSVTWNDGTTGLTKTVSPTATTSYTATCTVTNGNCTGTGTASGTVTVTPKPTPSVNSPTICTGNSATLTVSNCAGTVTWNDGTTGATKTVSPTATTTYTATCTVGSCTGTATGTVTVTTASNPTPSVNSPSICSGSSATLTVSNCAGSVTWNDGTTGLTKTVSPTATTSYTATCTVTNGNCTGTGTASGTVTVTPKPTPSVNSPTICASSSATLTVSNCAGTVTWNDGTAGATKTVSPTATTTYTATCTVGTCTGTASGTVTVTPNPTITINTSNISCSTDLMTYSLTFTATAGAIVTTDKGTLSGTAVSGIPSGQTVTLTASLNGCAATASATKSCNCPNVNPPTGTTKEICEGDAIPALSVTVDAGLQADWYSAVSGGTKLASGLNYTPTTAQYPLGGDFYVEAVNTTSNCKSATRTKVSLIINPKPTVTTQTTCAANGLSYSVTVTTNSTSITTDKGSVSGMTVTGIPVGQTVTITATSDKGCKVTTTATQNCTTSVFDLALKKTLATGQSANVVAGGTVKFTISIINQGNVGATNVQVSDYIPTGLTLNDANWTATGSTVTLNSMIASLPAGQTTTRDITFTVGNSVTGTITNFAEISAASNAQNLIDIDSTPDANATNDGTPKNDVVNENGKTGGDEDDHDPESITVIPNCVLPTFKVTTPSVCNTSTWSVGITVSQVGAIKVNKGTISGTGTSFTVSNIPSGTTLIITDSLSATCKKDTTIAPPAGCNCITAPPTLAIGQNTTVCKGELYPTLNAIIVGYGTVDWYKKVIGGTAVATGTLIYKPAGVVAANDTFYLQARNLAVGTCPDPTTRTRVIVVAQTCTDTVDLALKKMVDKKLVKLGDVVTFTIKVWNESNKNATGVEVTDSIATTMQFVNGSFVASRAATPPTIVGNVIKWNIGSIAANGDTVTLTYRVKATQEGVHFNTAEICKTNEKDIDSTPCNHKDDEDDIDRQCFTVPFKLCPNEKVEAVVPSTYTNVLWFKNGSSTAIASGNVVLLADVGIYTFTASNQTCPAEGCCPIIIETGTNCCPAELCIPFTIKKKK